MEKSIRGIVDMSLRGLKVLSVFSMVLLAGCAAYSNMEQSSCSGLGCDGNAMASLGSRSEDIPEQPNYFAQQKSDTPLTNYRESGSDYREFGERTPADQFITSANGGDNMSATIPPTIEEEVADYEEAVSEAFADAEELGGETVASDSGDDAVEDWLAEEGATLKGLLADWCERSGWRLIWNSNRNYTLSAGAMFRGRFADVSSALIRSFARAKPAPMATFYKGNRVLVVETREDENAYN